jgi:diguanylate cyclase (GGDEF)-like protein
MYSPAPICDESAAARRPSGIGVTTRLIALVMLPVTAACVLAGAAVLSHGSAAGRAVQVDHGAVALRALVDLRSSLYEQQTVSSFDVRLEQAGVSREVGAQFLGVDLGAKVAPARARAKLAVAALGPDTPVSDRVLRALFADIDGGRATPTQAVERATAMLHATDGPISAGFHRLGAQVDSPRLAAALESLQVASGLEGVTTPQVVALSMVWFPLPGDTEQHTSAALARLAADSARYAAAIASLHDLGDKRVRVGLLGISANVQAHAFERAVTSALRGEQLAAPGGALDLEMIAGAFRGYLVRDDLVDRLVESASTAVRDEARRVAAAERARFMTWALVAVALAIASVGIALALARSISKPLKRLARYAQAVNEGHLDSDRGSGANRGPREARVAFAVLGELVGNLQLLDAKANALAHCKFDDPVLAEPLPGRLGRSLESSVALLSGSIVERDALQNRLAHDATHDALTGVLNRPAAIAGIDAALHRANRTGAATAVLFVDLNEFKAVNDSHGHGAGDEVLRQVAARLTGSLRAGDSVARLGGDEFVVLAEDIDGIEGATTLARRIIDTIGQPIDLGEAAVTVGAALGIALSLDGPEEPLRLLARADAAMYRAKHHEHSDIAIFDADLQRQMDEREDIETALTAALSDSSGGGLQLHYQPVLDAASGRMVGAEALIRWDRPGHGRLAPDAFIPIAEATALIIDLDRWVLAEATRQLVEWSEIAELAEVPVSINISGRHLLSGLLSGHIRAALDETGIDPSRLSVEITETVLLTDLVAAAVELDAVRALGVKVAIDDFGTGYTSLAHLQHLPIDTIKIDRSFISQLNVRRGNSLVRMVTDLGHAIDINIVAEGVETTDELSALQAMGADHLQGYLLSRPLDPEAMATWAHGRAEADSGQLIHS